MSIESVMTLIFSNDYIFKELFQKQLDNMNKMLIQVYNEAVSLKSQVGDSRLIKKFKILL
jgi:hypothetical protein